jgi:hypothetical protein
MFGISTKTRVTVHMNITVLFVHSASLHLIFGRGTLERTGNYALGNPAVKPSSHPIYDGRGVQPLSRP